MKNKLNPKEKEIVIKLITELEVENKSIALQLKENSQRIDRLKTNLKSGVCTTKF